MLHTLRHEQRISCGVSLLGLVQISGRVQRQCLKDMTVNICDFFYSAWFKADNKLLLLRYFPIVREIGLLGEIAGWLDNAHLHVNIIWPSIKFWRHTSSCSFFLTYSKKRGHHNHQYSVVRLRRLQNRNHDYKECRFWQHSSCLVELVRMLC